MKVVPSFSRLLLVTQNSFASSKVVFPWLAVLPLFPGSFESLSLGTRQSFLDFFGLLGLSLLQN
jgi:hypothetical protein